MIENGGWSSRFLALGGVFGQVSTDPVRRVSETMASCVEVFAHGLHDRKWRMVFAFSWEVFSVRPIPFRVSETMASCVEVCIGLHDRKWRMVFVGVFGQASTDR